jgi:hypothetical protein
VAASPIKTNPSWQAQVTWKPRYFAAEVPAPQAQPRDPVAGAADEPPESESNEALTGTTTTLPEAETVAMLMRVTDCYVDVFAPDRDRIRFRVNRRGDRSLSFTDAREESFGTAGTTGIWGTRPPQPAGRRVVLTPTAFTTELARFVGAGRAEEILRTIRGEIFLESPTTIVRENREGVSP